MDGVINIYKERGFTSHDVVAKLRGVLRQKKIGHTGTLDPDAVGVLPVCLGKGTKICEFLSDEDKTYRAVLRLGVTTDTQDHTGKVLRERSVDVTEEQVREVIEEFEGKQMQLPPMYSALKVNGRKLYELAREGTLEQEVVPVEEMFQGLLRICCPESLDKCVHNGNPVSVSDLGRYFQGQIRMCDSHGVFIGIYQWREDRKRYYPVKMFYP